MYKIIFFSICYLIIMNTQAQYAKDTAAIRKVLEHDAIAWRANDIPAHAAGWHIQPYSRILVSTTDSKCYDVKPEDAINPPNGKLGSGGVAIMNNVKYLSNKSANKKAFNAD